MFHSLSSISFDWRSKPERDRFANLQVSYDSNYLLSTKSRQIWNSTSKHLKLWFQVRFVELVSVIPSIHLRSPEEKGLLRSLSAKFPISFQIISHLSSKRLFPSRAFNLDFSLRFLDRAAWPSRGSFRSRRSLRSSDRTLQRVGSHSESRWETSGNSHFSYLCLLKFGNRREETQSQDHEHWLCFVWIEESKWEMVGGLVSMWQGFKLMFYKEFPSQILISIAGHIVWFPSDKTRVLILTRTKVLTLD